MLSLPPFIWRLLLNISLWHFSQSFLLQCHASWKRASKGLAKTPLQNRARLSQHEIHFMPSKTERLSHLVALRDVHVYRQSLWKYTMHLNLWIVKIFRSFNSYLFCSIFKLLLKRGQAGGKQSHAQPNQQTNRYRLRRSASELHLNSLQTTVHTSKQTYQ